MFAYMKTIVLLLFGGVLVKSELHDGIGLAFTEDTLYSFEHEDAWLPGGEDSCSSYQDCNECSETFSCHWCEWDQQCHVIGSIFGCATGGKCDSKQTVDQKKHSKSRDSCHEYPNCLECDATHTCHWCAKDEACHAILSVYGCTLGVTCFDEDRCRRKKPEALPSLSRHTFTNLGLLPLILVGFIAALAFCCVSICFWFACGAKGAYDDMCGLIASRGNQDVSTSNDNDSEQIGSETVALITSTEDPTLAVDVPVPEEEEANQSTLATDGVNTDSSASPQLPTEEYMQEEEEQEATPLLRSRPNANDEQRIPEPKHAQRMLRICTCLYFLVVLTIGGCTFCFIRFFPMIPDYSVCNDGVQWGKLFRNLATLKSEVDFEILMSIENANHLGVIVERGNGTFRHGENIVGNYTIPSVEAPAMAISDALIIARLTPGPEEIISLAEEYVENTLVLHIDADLGVRLPFLFNYSTNVSITNQPIAINREEDRHLCNCKKW